ncbi:hypothetical protein HPB48_002378 [Haemaphysalis longicornis]|uniref:poly(A)-specific ribonuclease n=1 Tax=Haemaphysalis longicornis TaxID=44386 RepID=A0A9J6GGA5_HAELO|nr:hypothetical protein HPB48_002378 [Haemaphysalis longicornis]
MPKKNPNIPLSMPCGKINAKKKKRNVALNPGGYVPSPWSIIIIIIVIVVVTVFVIAFVHTAGPNSTQQLRLGTRLPCSVPASNLAATRSTTLELAVLTATSSGPDARSEFCGTERLVWPPNLEQGLDTIAHLVQTHHYSAMDTEFPGVLQWPHESQLRPYHYQYSLVRDNVNLMNTIPVGMTFPDRGGNPVSSCCTRLYTKTDRCVNDQRIEETRRGRP